MKQLETIAKKGILPRPRKKVKYRSYGLFGIKGILAVYRLSKLKHYPNSY